MKDTVLIVDNEDSILKCLNLMLRDDFHVLTAKSGNEALQILEKEKIECIVSDYDMENGDGLFFLRNLKKKEIPFILMTGHGEKDVFKAFANEHAFYIFEKPINSQLRAVVHQAMAAYHQTQKQLKESLVGKGTGQIIHDLNNQLHIIQSATETSILMPEQASGLMAMTLRACHKIEAMVSRYRNLMNGENHIQFSNIDLKVFMKDLLAECQIAYGSTVELHLDSNLSDRHSIVGDPDLLRQVFLNLISNSADAIKDSPDPSVRIRLLARDRITVVEIEDSGSISEDAALNLFKEGFSTKREKGTGMGLPYCQKNLNLMGASIRLAARTPTTFEITFDGHGPSQQA